MRIELNRNNIGQTVLDIIPDPKDNKWEVSEFNKFVDELKDFGFWIEKRNEPNVGDIVRFNANKHGN